MDDFDTQLQSEEVYSEYWELDEAYDFAPSKSGKMINNRMGTLKRIEDQLNRYRNAGIL
jgi:hypothetical protein